MKNYTVLKEEKRPILSSLSSLPSSSSVVRRFYLALFICVMFVFMSNLPSSFFFSPSSLSSIIHLPSSSFSPPSSFLWAQEKITLNLIQPPPSWGSPEGTGTISFFRENINATWHARIDIKRLTPNSRYVLALNGKGGVTPGNLELKRHGKFKDDKYKDCKCGEKNCKFEEGYYNFMEITTDANGNKLIEDAKVILPRGDYEIKFFVKNPRKNWRPALFNDNLRFSVR